MQDYEAEHGSSEFRDDRRVHRQSFWFWTLFWTLRLPGPLWTSLGLMGLLRAAWRFVAENPREGFELRRPLQFNGGADFG